MDPNDPWFWDVNRVVLELCTEQRSWAPTTATRRMPNPTSFEQCLREQEIDGSTLLTEVDESVLEHRLGVKVFGQLAYVKQVIRELRRVSQGYVTWKNTYGSEIHLASHVPHSGISISDIKKGSETSASLINPQIIGGISVKAEITGQSFNVPDRSFRGENWVTNTTENKRRKLELIITEANIEVLPLERDDELKGDDEIPFAVQDDHTEVENNLSSESMLNPSPQLEPTEPSKKRKRIAPTLITSVLDPDRQREIPTLADMVIDNDPQNIEPGVIYIGDDGRKRLIPLPQSEPDLDLPRRHQEQLRTTESTTNHALYEGGIQGLEAAEQILKVAREREEEAQANSLAYGYLGKKKFSVDEVFYHDIGLGRELQLTDDDDAELVKVTQGAFTEGRRLYIHRLMKNYLRSKPQSIVRGGKQFYALRPYAKKLAPMPQVPSFTLFTRSIDGEIHATRENLLKWPEADPSTSANSCKPLVHEDERRADFDLPDNLILGGPSSYDAWDPALLEKYRYIDGGDVVLPLYGESDEENEYDIETWNEIEEERGILEKPMITMKRRPLTTDEVNEAIEEGIAQTVKKWKDKKLPRRKLQAWKLWKKNRRDGSTRRRLRESQQHIDRIVNQRLPKMRDEILDEVWTSKKQVHQQTKIMEQSVFDREDLCWQISVLERKTEPEKPPPDVTVSKLKRPSAISNDGGESIEYETGVESSDDELEDFIVDDDNNDNDDISVVEADQRPADDEAEDLTASEYVQSSEEELEQSKPDKKRKTRASSPQPINSSIDDALNGHMDTAEISGSPDVMMTDQVDDQEEDERSASPQTRHSSIHLTADENIDTANELLPILKRKTSASQGAMPEVVDLTLLASDASDGEGYTMAPQNPDPVLQHNPKNNIRVTFKREGSPTGQKSPFIQISDSDDVTLPTELPSYFDPAAIATFPRAAWEKEGDRDRLLIGELFRMKWESKAALLELFCEIKEDKMWPNMLEVMEAIHRGIDRVRGMDQKTYMSVTGVIRLFEMYVDCKYRGRRDGLSSSLIDKLRNHKEIFLSFYDICSKTLNILFAEQPMIGEVPDEEDSDPIPAVRRKLKAPATSDSEDAVKNFHLPHKLRKKKIFENAQARDLREHDRQRLKAQEERRQVLQSKLAKSGSDLNADRARIIINDAKHEDQGFVYVHEQIGKRIKDHQIAGIRFMWSQIVTNEDVDQGCLLAHTMGLGKTMQVITLLVAISDAARSLDKSVSSQIPPNLRISRTLILCPPGLIENWMDELLMWAPLGVLGNYRRVDSASKSMQERLDTINSWHETGGILIIGYEMFRLLVQNKSSDKRQAPLEEEEHTQILEQLLDGPNIVVADEAHKMKNAMSSITSVASRFKSKSRIALTGSPLANNIEEYHTMIEWVAPNYLGPIVEFRAKYVEPIQEGLWYDSTPSERRKSMKMLKVLEEDLSPKVNRADISVLCNDLKPKTEFVITVPLTDLQRKAYLLYVQSMQGQTNELTRGGKLQQTTLWHWLAILSLLCNHPTCFRDKLSERKEDAKSRVGREAAQNISSDDDPITGATGVWKVGVSEELIRQAMELFKSFESGIDAIDNSYKVKLFLQILDASEAAGDKVLVFSSSIPTLNYLEGLCKRTHRDYARLDGNTKMAKRQDMTKKFNTGKTALYLISTTAGGLGLNLYGANRVIIFDFRFNPVYEEQAVGRAYRIGQQKPVFVYRFVVGGTFEETIHNKAIFKMQLASRVVDKKNPVAWAKRKIGDFLFEPKHVEQQDLSEYRGLDPHVLDKLLDCQNTDHSIRAIVKTDTFERHDNAVLTAEEKREVDQLLKDEKMKRSDPQAWRATVFKRQQASYEKQAQLALAATLSLTPAQQALLSNFNLTHTNHTTHQPQQVNSVSLTSYSSTQSPTELPKFGAAILDMTPIPGVNTRVRSLTPSAEGICRSVDAADSSAAAIPELVSGNTADRAPNGIEGTAQQVSRSSSSFPLKSPRSLHPPKSAEKADKELLVALTHVSRLDQSSPPSVKDIEAVARSIRLYIQTLEPDYWPIRVRAIARHLILDKKFSLQLLSKEKTAVDLAAMILPMIPANDKILPVAESLVASSSDAGPPATNGDIALGTIDLTEGSQPLAVEASSLDTSNVGNVTSFSLPPPDQSSDGRNTSPGILGRFRNLWR